MYDIFLSYSSKDLERVRPLFDTLTAQGWVVFWDHLSIRAGKNWSVELEQAINTSRCVVVVWSQSSIQSEYVREEANFAKRRGVLLPICLDKVEPPFGFTLRQATDFSQWNQKTDHPAFIHLASEICARLKAEQQLSPFIPVFTPKTKLRWPLYISVVLVALAVMVSYQFLPKLDQALEKRQAEMLNDEAEAINRGDGVDHIVELESYYKSTDHVFNIVNRSNKVLLKINNNSIWKISKDTVFDLRGYSICEVLKPSYCLNSEYSELNSSEIVPGWYSAKWIFESTNDGYFFIRNAWKVDLYIYINKGKVYMGQKSGKSLSFQWSLEKN